MLESECVVNEEMPDEAAVEHYNKREQKRENSVELNNFSRNINCDAIVQSIKRAFVISTKLEEDRYLRWKKERGGDRSRRCNSVAGVNRPRKIEVLYVKQNVSEA